MRLVQNYADEIIRLSRQEREKTTNQKKSRGERRKGAFEKKNLAAFTVSLLFLYLAPRQC